MLSLSPAGGQSGASTVTITVADAQGQTAQATFVFSVDNAAVVNGDQNAPNQDDVIRVVRNGANLNIFRNGTLVIDQALATAPSYLINGLGGSDTLIVDCTAGNPIPAAGLTLDGGSGADTVRFVGSSAADAVTLSAGNVAISGAGDFDYAADETLELQLGAGADTLTVAGNSAVTAQALLLTVAGGSSLSIVAGAVLPDFTDVAMSAGTTLNLGGQNQAIDALSGPGGTVLNTGAAAATLTVGSQGSSSTFAGTLANGTQVLSLTKVGAGTLTLSGSNGYTGASTLAGGVLESGNAASFAALAGLVQFLGGTFRVTADTVSANVLNKWTTTFGGATGSNTGTFDVAAGVTLTIGTAGGLPAWRTGGGTSAGGPFIKTGAGTLRVFGGNNQQDDPIQLNQGSLFAEHADALGRGDAGVRVDMKGGTTLVLRNDAGSNFQTPINAVDAGQAINVVVDRQTAGPGVTHSVNALTSVGAFTLNVSAGANVTSGTAGLTIGSATLGGNATFNVGSAALVTVSGAINAGTFGLTKSGAGTLTLAGANAYTGGTTVNAGTLLVANGDALAAGAIAIADGAAVRAQSSLAKGITISTFAIAGTGYLDLANNAMVFRGMTSAQVQSAIATGFNQGNWNGHGINSAAAAADPNGDTALGVAGNAVLNKTSFAGVTGLGATDVLVKYTYSGDANLDGQVDIGDLGLLAGAWQQSGKSWFDGDFTYDGVIDIGDLGLLAGNWQKGVGNPL
jgi:autotransporter-associated beta strand protein